MRRRKQTKTIQSDVIDLYRKLQEQPGTSTELLGTFEKLIETFCQEIKDKKEQNERLRQVYAREKEEHSKHLNEVELELDQQVTQAAEKARQKERERLEEEKAALRDRLENEITELNSNIARLQRLEANINEDQDKSQQLKEIKGTISELNNENRNLRSSLISKQTEMALVNVQMDQIRQEMIEKCGDFANEEETLMSYIQQQDDLTSQLQHLYDTNARLHHANDSLCQAIEGSRRQSESHSSQSCHWSPAIVRRASDLGKSNPQHLTRSPNVLRRSLRSRRRSDHSPSLRTVVTGPSPRSPLPPGGPPQQQHHNHRISVQHFNNRLSPNRSSGRRTIPRNNSGGTITTATSGGKAMLLSRAGAAWESQNTWDSVELETDNDSGVVPISDEGEIVFGHGRKWNCLPDVEECNRSDVFPIGDVDPVLTTTEEEGEEESLNFQPNETSAVEMNNDNEHGSYSTNHTANYPTKESYTAIQDDNDLPEQQFRVVLVGETSVGKSSLLMRLVNDRFKPHLASTVGVDFKLKTVRVDGRKIALQLWDTAGQERFRSMCHTYFRRADGALLVYDCTMEESFLKVRNWVSDIQDSVPFPIPIIICGNKTDLRTLARSEGKTVVDSENGESLAKNCDSLFIETSAKDGTNVMEACINLTREMLKHSKKDDNFNSSVRLNKATKTSKCCLK